MRQQSETGRFPRIPDVECAELLRERNDVFVSVLLNTQVTKWKVQKSRHTVGSSAICIRRSAIDNDAANS